MFKELFTPAYDMIAHLARQVAFSRATFGPGPRTGGVIEHVKKELDEIEKVYAASNTFTDSYHTDAAQEWVDVAILGLDGLLRALWAAYPSKSSTEIAILAVEMIAFKQAKNERRDWPDWRAASPDKAIEHVRGKED